MSIRLSDRHRLGLLNDVAACARNEWHWWLRVHLAKRGITIAANELGILEVLYVVVRRMCVMVRRNPIISCEHSGFINS